MRDRIGMSIVGASVVALFFVVVHRANLDQIPHWVKALYDYPGGDKVGHVFVMGVLSVGVCSAWWAFVRKRGARSYFLPLLFLSVLVTAEEISQAFLSTRTFSLLDLLFSFVGLLLGSLLAGRLRRRV